MSQNLVNRALFRLFVPIPMGALVYLVLLMINDNLIQIESSFISQELFFCVALAYVILETNRLALVIGQKWLDDNVGSYAVAAGINLALSILVVWISLYIYFVNILGYPSLSAFQNELKSFGLIYGSISLLYNMLFTSHAFLNKRNDSQFEQEQTLRDQLEYELNSYQNELKPTLFFESLESAILLLHENADEAEYFLDKLAMVYRYVLLNRDKETIGLQQDLKATEDLVYLLNTRHNNEINFDSTVDKERFLVLPGTLPGLVEDIVSTTLISRNQPLNISVYAEDGYLNIKHKLNDRLNKQASTQAAFYELQHAYAIQSDNPVMKVRAYGEVFYKIPLIDEVA